MKDAFAIKKLLKIKVDKVFYKKLIGERFNKQGKIYKIVSYEDRIKAKPRPKLIKGFVCTCLESSDCADVGSSFFFQAETVLKNLNS